MHHKKKAIVLSSGGLDSTTAMAIAKNKGFDVYSLSFFYGQRHAEEVDAAKKVASFIGSAEHLLLNIDLTPIGGSALTDQINVPKDRNKHNISEEIPVTYVPARNTIFLSFALAWAEVIQSSDIFIGVNAVDYSGYPDCRPEYIEAFERMSNLATKAGLEGRINIKIRTPLMHMTKSQIIRTGLKLGVDYSITHSCYDPFPGGLACGRCDSCILRKKGFEEAGAQDPLPYKTEGKGFFR